MALSGLGLTTSLALLLAAIRVDRQQHLRAVLTRERINAHKFPGGVLDEKKKPLQVPSGLPVACLLSHFLHVRQELGADRTVAETEREHRLDAFQMAREGGDLCVA